MADIAHATDVKSARSMAPDAAEPQTKPAPTALVGETIAPEQTHPEQTYYESGGGRKMESILRQHGADIDGVWAAWDEPAVGALIAVQADLPDSTMLIAGIDGNPQAVELIGDCTNLIGSVRQDFAAMSTMAADALAAVFAGGSPEAEELYAPSILITRDSVGANCG